MLTANKKTAPVQTVKMVCPAGKLVPRPPGPVGYAISKERKFYNWPRDENGTPVEDAVGFPVAADIPEVTVEVPADHHHLITCIHKGPCCIADEASAVVDAPVVAAAAPQKTNKRKGNR